MDYEKLYKDALERAKNVLNRKATDRELGTNIPEYIFPVLKESNDEKIRKEIISALKFANIKGIYNKHIAWLEKQGEQKPVDFKAKDWYVSKVDGKIHNMTYNPTDKVEPNPTWSEADERNLKSIMKIIKEKAFADYDVDEDNNMLGIYGILESWLKSLKERMKGG